MPTFPTFCLSRPGESINASEVGMRVTVIGAGYVGLASALAIDHIEHTVRVLEKDQRRMRLLVSGVDPLDEPLFSELLSSSSATFTTDPRAALESAEAVILAVGTPHLPDGRADLSFSMVAA